MEDLDELLAVPLGMHPEQTPQARQRRMDTFAQAAAGMF